MSDETMQSRTVPAGPYLVLFPGGGEDPLLFGHRRPWRDPEGHAFGGGDFEEEVFELDAHPGFGWWVWEGMRNEVVEAADAERGLWGDARVYGYEGAWRQATADELVRAGLCAPPVMEGAAEEREAAAAYYGDADRASENAARRLVRILEDSDYPSEQEQVTRELAILRANGRRYRLAASALRLFSPSPAGDAVEAREG